MDDDGHVISLQNDIDMNYEPDIVFRSATVDSYYRLNL